MTAVSEQQAKRYRLPSADADAGLVDTLKRPPTYERLLRKKPNAGTGGWRVVNIAQLSDCTIMV